MIRRIWVIILKGVPPEFFMIYLNPQKEDDMAAYCVSITSSTSLTESIRIDSEGTYFQILTELFIEIYLFVSVKKEYEEKNIQLTYARSERRSCG